MNPFTMLHLQVFNTAMADLVDYFAPNSSTSQTMRVILDSSQVSSRGADGTEMVTVGITVDFEKSQLDKLGVSPKVGGRIVASTGAYKLKSRIGIDPFSEKWSAIND